MRSGKEKKKSRIVTALKLALGTMLLLTAGLFIAASVLFRFDEWHELDPSLITGCPQAVRLYDNKGELISVIGEQTRIWIPLESLGEHTKNAFISAEDARFYTHEGIDIYRIFGAAWADIKAGGFVQGASTISQQLIKLSHLSSEKTLDRKLEEAVLSIQLERRFDKDEILEMYLNYIYFGGGFYGIEAASLGYFGIHASELSAAQSAQLAGILKSPTAYAPHIDPEASLERRNTVLGLMHGYGYLNDEEFSSALEEECVLSPGVPSYRSCTVDHALNEAAELLGISSGELIKSGYSVFTTIDTEISRYCDELMKDDSLFPSENAQGAVAVLSDRGAIEAICGGRGAYDKAGVNRAECAERQPGSLIKPILVYAPAIESFEYDAASLLDDSPKSFGEYEPRNSDEKYYGTVTLRTAVSRSLNIPAVSVLEDIGVENAVSFAKRLGIDFEGEKLGLPLALGGFTHGVTPLEMAGAYAAISNGGVYSEPYSVIRIEDAEGNTIYERAYSGERVMKEESAFILTSLLKSVVTEGTGKKLLDCGIPLAAKTGTSVDEGGVRDAWCAAYTKEHTAVIWMGTDSSDLGSLPQEATGGKSAAVVLCSLFKYIYADSACPDFEKPDNVSEVPIDVSRIAEGEVFEADENTPAEYVLHEYFVTGSESFSVNPLWARPEPPEEIGWSIDTEGYPTISFVADNATFIYRLTRSSSEGEKSICEWEGASGYLSYNDTDTDRGGVYSYWITAENPQLKNEDGSPLSSEPSRKIRIVVPFY